MKRVLFIIGSFEIGGSRSSLISLLSSLNSSKVQADVFARENVGPLKQELRDCSILPENVWLSHRIYERNAIKKMFNRFLYYVRGIMQFIGVDMYKLYNRIGGHQLHIKDYDAVIGFDETLARTLSSYKAKKRIIWIHCDYRRYYNGKSEEKYYAKIDSVVCVSNLAKNSFLEIYPQFYKKVVIVNNIIDRKRIYQKAGEKQCDIINFDKSKDRPFVIVSIGRYDSVKQFERIPQLAAAVRELLQSLSITKTFVWWIIGGGNDKVKMQIEEGIRANNVISEVKLLGMKQNVYPYLSAANLNVCTSASETFSYTIHEGLVLGIPFLCNNFQDVEESLESGKGGYVIPLEEMPLKITEMMKNPMRVVSDDYSSQKALDVFYSLL